MTLPAAQAPQWAAFMLEYHVFAGYLMATLFPLWRYGRRKFNGHTPSITMGTFIHQAATGFILPSFMVLLGATAYPPLLHALTGHEMGLAGIFGIIVSGRELCVHE